VYVDYYLCWRSNLKKLLIFFHTVYARIGKNNEEVEGGKMKQKLKLTTYLLSAWFLLALLIVPQAQAAPIPISVSGNFTDDDDVQTISFTVASASLVTLKTTSAHLGGFDTTITLFDSSNNMIAENDDGTFAQVGNDTATGIPLDSFLQLNLAAADYTLALTQWDNIFDGGVGDPFSFGFTWVYSTTSIKLKGVHEGNLKFPSRRGLR